MELHTYIKCSKCGESVRASKHTPEECQEFYINSQAIENTQGLIKKELLLD